MISTANVIKEYREGQISAVRLQKPTLFDTAKIFDCGQCFRFDEVKETRHTVEFAGVAQGKYISVAEDGDDLIIYNSDEEEFRRIWHKFLALDRNYEEINENILSLSDNPALVSALKVSSGIRILRQDEWEALCSFIISQNNNIPRIKKIICSLASACGEPVDMTGMNSHIATSHRDNEGNFHAFPTPASLHDIGIIGLAEKRVGFRAKYIYDATEKLLSGDISLDTIKCMQTTSDAAAELCRICGVGPKVAACTLLFGFGRLDAFPVDVWIKKVIEKYFDDGFDARALGEYAGVAQQYLFYYERYLRGET